MSQFIIIVFQCRPEYPANMSPATCMGAAIKLAEVGICIVGISHQGSFEFTKEFLNHLALPATEEIITHLRRQIDDDPHITLYILVYTINLYLGPYPSLIAVYARTHLQQHLFDVLLTTF